MTDQELAKLLFEAGLLTKEQITTAAAQRSGRNFAQTVVELGFLSSPQIEQFAPQAFGKTSTQTFSKTSSPAQVAQRFPDEAFEQTLQPQYANLHGNLAPPIPDPIAPRLPHVHSKDAYEKYDSSRLLFYSVLGAIGCGIAAIGCFFYSLDGLSKVQSGRIDPVHKTKISISLALSIFGIILVVLIRVFAASHRQASPY